MESTSEKYMKLPLGEAIASYPTLFQWAPDDDGMVKKLNRKLPESIPTHLATLRAYLNVVDDDTLREHGVWKHFMVDG